jgi:hypothetical protein
MCSHLVHLAETPVLTIDNMLLDLLQSLSYMPSWHRAAQLSYSPTQTGGHKIVFDDDISIYTPKELERLGSLRAREFIHTHVYDVNLLKKGEMDINLPTLFRAVGWSFVMRFLASPLLVKGIRWIEHMMEGQGRAQAMLRSSIDPQTGIINNLFSQHGLKPDA